LRPAVAENYLKFVIKQFDDYAKEKYLPALEAADAEPETILAALNYVRTRKVQGHEQRLREIFTAPWTGHFARDIREACLDALVRTSEDPDDTARFLILTAATTQHDHVEQLCKEGLLGMRDTATAVLLDELPRTEDGHRRRKLALLLAKVSRVGMPEPLRFWRDAEAAEIQAAVDEWRTAIEERRARRMALRTRTRHAP
jgi:hypothetical protein